MASEEHKKLASTIKNIHQELRELSLTVGHEEAWRQHLEDEEKLKLYAYSMRELAEKHWTHNTSSEDRIQWAVNFCGNYFCDEVLERWKEKDLRVIEFLRHEGIVIEILNDDLLMTAPEKLECCDVGSSGNFFKNYERFNVLPIDISPSDDSVYRCDFLSVTITDSLIIDEGRVSSLPVNHFHVVIFCLLLEYLPSSAQRIECCQKAYTMLKTHGILIIITPDSSHEMKNSRQIKNWRWTLAKIGLQRVKVEKLKNLTCMAFRKCLNLEVSRRWADQHYEDHMKFKLEIPQDQNKYEVNEDAVEEFDVDVMSELPGVWMRCCAISTPSYCFCLRIISL